MRALIDILIQYKLWLLFLLLEAISFLFLFSFNGRQRSVFFTTANDVVGSAYSVISSITSYIQLQEENERLEATNEQLRQQLYAMRQQLEDSKLVNTHPMKALPPLYHTVPAKVVNLTLHKANNLITINKGEADGIRPEMGVVNSQGVVGIVYMTSQHYSIVMPLLNVNSKVSCRLRHSEYFGSLIWQRGCANIAYATSIPRHVKVKKNDIVETNGYSDVFPAGLPIGAVAGFGDSADGMSYMLKVKLFANFTTLREVSVITNYHSPERRLLEQQAEDPAKQDSILAEQEKRKAAELKELEQRKAAEQRAVDKEIQEELEKQFIQAQGAQTVQDTEKADTVR